MNQTRRLPGLLVLLIALVGGLAFAGGQAEPETGPQQFTMYWNTNHRYDAYQEVIDQFAEENNLEIDVQTYLWPDMRTKLLTDFSGNTVPDLIQIPATWIAEFGANGLMRDMTDDIAAWPESADWLESTWIEVSVDGRRYGMKNHHTTFGLFYNRELFRQAGLDPDNPPRTLTEFRDQLEIIASELGPEIMGFAFDQDAGYLVNFFANEDVPYLVEDDQIAIGTPEVAASLEILQEIAANGWALIAEPGASYQTARRAFFEGSVAMMLSGPWDLATLANEVPDLDYGITAPPSLEGLEPRTIVAGTAVGIPAGSRHPELAWELIQRLTDVEVQIAATQEAGMLMPRRSWAEDPRVQAEKGVADFARILPFARPFDIEVASRGISELTWSGGGGDLTTVLYQNIIYNRDPAAEALADYVREGNQLLQRR
jgi:multiple sugar transport system substrate-binding protein